MADRTTTESRQGSSKDKNTKSQVKPRTTKSGRKSPPAETLKLTKSAKSSKPRLNRTLKRKPDFHPIREEDMRYLWAAYKKGAFKGDFISIEEGLPATEFNNLMRGVIFSSYNNAYVLEAKVGGKQIPVGIVFSVFAGPFHLIGDMTWFPWSSNRNRVEAAVHFLNEMRKDNLMIWYSHPDDSEFYVHIARHGITKRVGSIDGLFKGVQARFWQTRAK